MKRNPLYMGTRFRRFSYVTRGLYAEQLERWMSLYPAQQILVLDADRFFSNPPSIFDEILRFLDLPVWAPPQFRNHSYLSDRERESRATVRLKPRDREALEERFAEPNRRLRDLLGGKAGGFSWL